jgi:hypothetical protein
MWQLAKQNRELPRLTSAFHLRAFSKRWIAFLVARSLPVDWQKRPTVMERAIHLMGETFMRRGIFRSFSLLIGAAAC